MDIKRGDIYWINPSEYRPAQGSVQRAGRPGIIVSNDSNNACANTLEIVYLTTSPKRALPTHCTVTSHNRTSTVLCEQVQTVSDEQIGEYYGTCTPEEMAEVDRCIAISLGLPEPDEQEIAFLTDGEKEDLEDTISRLETELSEANAKLELMRELYDRLLESTRR